MEEGLIWATREMSKVKLDDLPERYRRQAEAQIDHRASNSVADLEPGAGDEQVAKEKTKGFDPPLSYPVRIHIHSARKRLCDADGACGKYAIDGLIHAGIIPNDDPAHVREVSYSQEKAAGRAEETIITIEEL